MDFKRQTVSHHEDVFVRYSIEQYKDVGRTRWDPYKNEPITNAAGLCYIWRKIVNTDESRQLALLEIVEKHPRAIIFYNFDYELELLKELFIPHADTMYFEIAEWNGHKHQPIPKSESWVYLVQYNAGIRVFLWMLSIKIKALSLTEFWKLLEGCSSQQKLYAVWLRYYF